MLLPSSQGGITPAGTFWTFSAITIFGGFWAWFFIPETAGRSLESMDKLFTLKWYQIGRKGADEADMLEFVEDEKMGEMAKNGTSTQIERVDSRV